MDDRIVIIEQFVQREMAGDSTGHDWWHVDRVRNLALYICKREGKGDFFLIEAAALLHDIIDDKLSDSPDKNKEKLFELYDELKLNNQEIEAITYIIENISYRGGNETLLNSFEAKVVRDADRLDAMGAIGIARAFAYGGYKHQTLYDPEIAVRETMTFDQYRSEKSSSIHHFYEKLLLLKERMHTYTAKEIAKERHEFMETFLDHFYKEWNGQR